ncbi:MAG: hydrogenase iron-sulfur subunit [Bacteroidales bacterium]
MKLGIFICTGCHIGGTLDVGLLCTEMAEELSPVVCKSHGSLCSPDGIRTIMDDVEAEQLSGCLVAGCGTGTKDENFRIEELQAVERVNLRELVAWSMEPGNEDTFMAAEDYVRMGYAGLKHMTGVTPFLLDVVSQEILVVGGGVAGMKAAIDGAENGYKVHLLEKTGALGGWGAAWSRQIPFDQPFKKLREPIARDLISQVENNPDIRIYLEVTIDKIEGQPGAFMVKLNAPDTEVLRVGSIVMASGWRPYLPASGPFYRHGEIPGVITSVEFESEMSGGSCQSVESVLFIQCAGSRDENHLSYCSSVCCGVSLKQAMYIRAMNPDTIVYIVYKDIRTPGFLENFYKEVQHDPNIIFLKGTVQSVEPWYEEIDIHISDQLLGEELFVRVNKVILATGMVPNETTDLKLAYRLGEGIPSLKYAFADSHFICFPYESRRTGIYTAGGIRAPMDIPSAMEDGSGAMMKAIQMIEAAKRGDAVHPRAGDKSFPELYLERCTDCKRCTEECPFGTFDETSSGTPVVNPNRCRRCGICLGACPERVISFADYSITILSDKIKAVKVPGEFEEKPRVLVFVCENDALPALLMAARKGLKINPFVRIIPVRCLGSINRVWVSDALSKGYDGILQIGCKPGEDYQCHFIHGSELSEKRSEIFEETLTSMMLEPERICTRFVEINDYRAIIEQINNYMEEMKMIGPNPFKDM